MERPEETGGGGLKRMAVAKVEKLSAVTDLRRSAADEVEEISKGG